MAISGWGYTLMVRRPQGGFSLVEVLVVIAVIAILLAILMPSMNKVRESAKQLKCAVQLRQVGQAIFSYAAMNRGLTPAWSVIHHYPDDPPPEDPGQPDYSGPGWVVLLLQNRKSRTGLVIIAHLSTRNPLEDAPARV